MNYTFDGGADATAARMLDAMRERARHRTALAALLALAAALAMLGPAASAQARKHHLKRIAAPHSVTPADGARVQGVPAFGWNHVRGAAHYEFQLAADNRFRSVVDNGNVSTQNTYATTDKTLADGTYYWRVRAVSAKGRASGWSHPWSIQKQWTLTAAMLAPADGAGIAYPANPLVLRWRPVPYAHKYLVTIATDPSLAQPVVSSIGNRLQFGSSGAPIETPMPAFALSASLPAGRYYWAVTPEDARGHRGVRSPVRSFVWRWPTRTNLRVTNLVDRQGYFDPQFSWDAVPGAARYEVEINSTPDFTPGSRVCCSDPTTGTSLTPTQTLNNDTDGSPPGGYWWRVRAIDLAGNAGQWNYGAPFRREFDDVPTTVPNLRVRNNEGEFSASGNSEHQTIDPSTGPQTASPVVAWNPVAGAQSYDVQVVEWVTGGCNWTQSPFTTDSYQLTTASTAWTPLAPISNGAPNGQTNVPVTVDFKHLFPGQPYCVRVRAHADRDTAFKDVVSDWTKIGGTDEPSFTYTGPAGTSRCADVAPQKLTMPAAYYREPASDSATMPLFTWLPVTGAGSYYVVVATDERFQHIVDQALTNIPAYAPRNATSAKTYPDGTAYYYAVMPAVAGNGCYVLSTYSEDNPHTFSKLSNAPMPLSPAIGANVSTQPTFHWSSTPGARNYRLQVSQDPSFGTLIDDVTTDATSYTSSSTYPVDTLVYWRVRANDASNTGLAWSRTGTFRRRLAAPRLAPFDPAAAETPPILNWSLVQGATSYDVHVEQSDGQQRDFPGQLGTASTWSSFYGTGATRVSIRARFPTGRSGETPGPWSPPRLFTRYINPPPNARGTLRNGSALVAWDPSPIGKQYKVEISTTNSFTTTLASVQTDNTSWAPDLSNPAYKSGVGLYWRVATVDDGNNIGAWTTGVFRKPRGLRVRARGRVRHGRRSRIVVLVRDSHKHRVKGASVTVSGAGVIVHPRRTKKSGKAVFRVKALLKGKLVITAGKNGWNTGSASLRVR